MSPIQFEFESGQFQQTKNNFENDFNQNFGLRNELIHLNNYLSVRFLKYSPVKKVLLGSNDWLFIDVDTDGSIIDRTYRTSTHLDEKTLQIWAKRLSLREKWLRDRGISYYFVISPEKSTIYPEFLPNRINKVQQTTRYDQLMEYLQSNQSDFEYLDTKKILLEQKDIAPYPLYYQTDSHWNSYGAFIIYQNLMDLIDNDFPSTLTLDETHFNIYCENTSGGDLTRLISATDHYSDHEIIFERIKGTPYYHNENQAIPEKLKQYNRPTIYHYCETCPDITVLVLRDSFSNALIPHISKTFRHTRYVYSHSMTEELITAVQPDIVIDEIAERFLHRPLSEPEAAHLDEIPLD